MTSMMNQKMNMMKKKIKILMINISLPMMMKFLMKLKKPKRDKKKNRKNSKNLKKLKVKIKKEI